MIKALADAVALCQERDTEALMRSAAEIRDQGHGNIVSHSPKVFVPLTRLCRNACGYCAFSRPSAGGGRAYMTPEEVLAIARAGAAAGCGEVLFTLGDKPELRHRVAREELERLGHETTLSYLREVAELVFRETGLLPHVNPGVTTAADMAALRSVSVSQGLMLESMSERLSDKGGPHHRSPDKRPAARLETIRLAGELRIPFTSGILIGIGETRRERIEALLALRGLHERYGHIQEVIVQNFRAKPDTPMADAAEPDPEELRWTIAAARILFGPAMNIQAPPNLSPGGLGRLIDAGLNDWGGVSPLTADHVNPEAPWPRLEALERETAARGKVLTQRLAIYPGYALDGERWLDPGPRTWVRRRIDADGFARTEPWSPGEPEPPPADVSRLVETAPSVRAAGEIDRILAKATDGEGLGEAGMVRLFQARGDDFAAVAAAADRLRARVNGDVVTYVVNRNINYTNVCYFGCGFCAYSKGRPGENTRQRPYQLDLAEIVRRTREAWARGATEICVQGGIHPDYTGRTYLDICRAVKEAVPGIHIHAFSPLEVWQGARTLGVGVPEFLGRLREAGLGTLPGTAAEVLDDEVRAVICPDKIDTRQWLDCISAAHGEGFRTTATIMFGHVDEPRHWARHLTEIRALQARTGGFTEFVPLPFVPMEAPMYLKGRTRKGPTFREAVLMHAVARLALHPHIANIQASWAKMGPEGVKACLRAGANDLGGTLMNESVSRSAGASHGQEMPPERMEALIRDIGRTPAQRTALYDPAPASRVTASFGASRLSPAVATPAGRGGLGRRRPVG